MGKRRNVAKIIISFLFLFLLPSIVYSYTSRNRIKDIRFSSNSTFTRVVVECENRIVYRKNLLKFPDRIYFDLRNTLPLSFHKKEIPINDSAVKSVKVGRYNSTTTRVVLQLNSYDDFNIYTLENPHRLVVEVTYSNTIEKYIPRRRIVVIDPGHGGRDPGAIGRTGVSEKNIVLDIAKRLKKVLESKYAVEVFLTRNDDRYLELRERAIYANKKNADLFVSIHANASKKRRTKGIETWFLNYTSNKEYQQVAARENAISLEKQQEVQTIEEKILTSLATQFKREGSLRLAHYIQKSLVKNLRAIYRSHIKDLGVKYAFFYVLSTDMPSALIEVGFMTNRDEERRLRKASYRKNLAHSIAKGINAYLATLPDTPKLAKR